jgi:hypothetical protein
MADALYAQVEDQDALAAALNKREVVYEFSNGRKFIGKRDPYAP